MLDLFGDVLKFHRKFGLPIEISWKPRWLKPDESKFRVDFMQEELDEYKAAVESGDMAAALDALVDLTYVALGTALWHGFDFNEAWRRVQACNMAKQRAEHADQSKRGVSFDVIKPPGWVGPNHDDLVGG